MKTIIHIAAEAEPKELHGALEAEEIFGVHLAAAIEEATDEDEAKSAVDSFLAELPAGSFHLYQVDAAGGRATHIAELSRLYAFPTAANLSLDRPRTMEWLHSAKVAFWRLAEGRNDQPTEEELLAFPFYAAPVASDTDMRNARAVDLLRATAKWPAPLAQDIGLTVPLRSDDARQNPGQSHVIVFLSEALDQNSATVNAAPFAPDEPVVLSVIQDGSEAYGISAGIVPVHTSAGALLEDTGRFITPADNDTLARLVSRIEERSPSLLVASTMLDDIALNETVLKELASLADDQTLPDDTALPADVLHWLMQAGFVTLFDVPLVALTAFEPAQDKSAPARQKSAVLQRLSRIIAGYYETDPVLAHPVDEVALYRLLHDGLRQHLADLPTPDALWKSLSPLLPIETRRNLIDAAMSATPTGGVTPWKKWREDLTLFYEQLAEVSVFLESESGAEAWLLERCKSAYLDENSGVFNLDLAAAGIPAEQTGKLTELFGLFRQMIEGEFNASEAMRRDFGILTLTRVVNNADADTAGGISNAVRQCNWFRRRLMDRPDPAAPLDDFVPSCVPLPALPNGEASTVGTALAAAFAQRADEIIGEAQAVKGRFVADHAPVPLPIRIAASIDYEQIDKLSGLISGLGFLVRAVVHAEDGSVAQDECHHASLLGLYDRVNGKDELADPVVLPTLPILNPGSSALFIHYSGAPLASPNRVQPGRGGAVMETGQLRQAREQANIRGYVERESKDAPPLPALAYGRTYGVSSFWIPGSGVLPEAVRSAPDTLFLPGGADGAFKPENTALHPYLRRTAISDTNVSVPARVPDGVFPLSLDDPRLVLESFDKGERHLDLCRRQDGTGALTTAEGSVTLHGVTFSAGLTVNDLEVVARSVDGTAVPLTGCVHDEETATLTIPFDSLDAQLMFWLRLGWADNASPGGCVSFDDPAHANGQSSADRQGTVVLVAPDGDWNVPRDQSITLEAPRVSFADLECWARNRKLWQKTASGTDEQQEALFRALRQAQALLVESGHPKADLLNRLPDPSVRALVVCVAEADEIAGERQNAGNSQHELELAPYDVAGLIVPPIGPLSNKSTQERDSKKSDEQIAEDRIEALVKLIETICKRAERTVTVRHAGSPAPADTPDSDLLLQIPEGRIVRLVVHPAVPSEFLKDYSAGGVFDPGMKSLAAGRYGDRTLFDGPKLQIEAIRDISNAVLPTEDRLQTIAAGRQRSYALDFAPRESDRLFAQAQLGVQQWHPTGRPIYRWISPVPDGLQSAMPVVPLTVSLFRGSDDPDRQVGKVYREELEGFEADAFFGVKNDALDRSSVIRLDPAPAATRLWSQDWPERSATYFRHRLTLRSRYAAAAGKPQTQTRDISAEDTSTGWLNRVVILAEPLAGDLSRPQLRALFPTQQSVREKGILPVACVLSEPPFAQLGLADRFEAELKTTNTYTFKSIQVPQQAGGTVSQDRLQVGGLRKEIGPDPLLSYFSVNDTASRNATLDVEGPAGLHFDAETVSAPAFSNCQYMLHVNVPDPASALPSELEESFVGVVASRRADPAWSFAAAATPEQETNVVAPTKHLPDFSASWIDLVHSQALIWKGTTVAMAVFENDTLFVRVLRETLFKDGGTGLVDLCALDAREHTFALLVQPLGDGRFRLSVYRKPMGVATDEDVKSGRMALPKLIASVQFSAGEGLELNPPARPKLTRQSDVTFMRWARTARDMGHVAIHADDGLQTEDWKSLTDLIPKMPVSGNGRLEFRDRGNQEKRIASPVSLRRYPLHVHRRFGLILYRPSGQIGHQVSLFDKAVIADGWGQAEVSAVPDASVSLIELETRAEIIRVKDGVDPPQEQKRYEAGHFDLKSNRGKEDISRLQFHLRAANKAINLRKLVFNLSWSELDENNEAKTHSRKLEMGIDEHLETWSLDLTFFSAETAGQSDGKAFWSHRLPGAPALLHEETDGFDSMLKAEFISLSIDGTGSTLADCWVDVSMLHSKHRLPPEKMLGTEPFDFDWIFGQDKPPEDLTEALSLTSLNMMTEAQARIIGVSDAIPIKFSDS